MFKYCECIDHFPYKTTLENGQKHGFQTREKRILTWNPSLAEKQECGSLSSYIIFHTVGEGDDQQEVCAAVNQDKIRHDMELAGYNLLVTSEYKMPALDIYKTYHELWRIEESFRTMKSDLDARPVYLQREDRIKGHFLVCYLTIVLIWLLQIKVLKDDYGTEQIMEFIRKFDVVPDLGINSKLTEDLEKKWKLLLTNYYLQKSDINKMPGLKLQA